MRVRNIVLAAVVAVPLMWGSAPVAAQQRGNDRSAAPAWQPSASQNGVEHRQSEPPKGVMRRFSEGLVSMLPPGVRRRFGQPEVAQPEPDPQPEPQPEPEPEPEPEPQPEPEPCITNLVYVNGVPMLQDCNGNLTPLFGG